MKTNTALITGASAGIGKELARLHGKAGGDVILVARRQTALDELKTELEQAHGITAHVFAADLGSVEGTKRLHADIKAAGLTVDILINNAGFSQHGAFADIDLDTALGIVEVNLKSLMTLTHLVLPEMIARGSGRILNVGSTAGMIPGPLQATYHASKAFVNSFSLALADELEDKGITVTNLAPGAVATEFFERGDMTDMNGVQQGVATAPDVARIGYDAMTRGDLLVINDRKLRFTMNWLVPFLPRRRVLKLARAFGEKAA
jgi:hypothetical protein